MGCRAKEEEKIVSTAWTMMYVGLVVFVTSEEREVWHGIYILTVNYLSTW